MKTPRFTPSIAVAMAALALQACDPESPPGRGLVSPPASRIERAQRYRASHPTHGILFSQLTGRILRIEASGADPLAQARSLDGAGGLRALRDFAATELLELSPDELALAASDTRDGMLRIRAAQTFEGRIVKEAFAVARFDSELRLVSVVARLIPRQEIRAEDLAPAAIATDTATQALTGRRRGPLRPSLVEAPQGWRTGGAPTSAIAPRFDGAPTLILSTSFQDRLVMGFRLNGIHAPGEAVEIVDDRDPDWRALATDADSWLAEREYTGAFRAATSLSQNLATTLRWYDSRLGWKSWDNRGSTLIAAVRGREEYNAFGGHGAIEIGSGLSDTGQPISDALDVVAHEFAHSVMTATTDLVFSGETGALCEAIADFLGNAVEGGGSLYGEGAGGATRDLLHPGDFGLPESYGEFRELPSDDDHGGIHVNLGIFTRALALAGGNDPVAVSRAVLAALDLGVLPLDLKMEEFAALLSSLARDSTLDAAFDETDLLDFTALD